MGLEIYFILFIYVYQLVVYLILQFISKTLKIE